MKFIFVARPGFFPKICRPSSFAQTIFSLYRHKMFEKTPTGKRLHGNYYA